MPDQSELPTAGDGVVLSVAARVQCLDCGEVVEIAGDNPEPVEGDPLAFSVECPACSRKSGGLVVIRLVVLCGAEVAAAELGGEEGGEDPIVVAARAALASDGSPSAMRDLALALDALDADELPDGDDGA